MRVIRTNESNETYSGRNVGEDCADLPCRIEPDKMVATYAFTDEERRQIAQGATLRIAVFQHPMPPISLAINDGEVVEQWQPDDLICVNTEECGSVWREDRGMTHCGHCGGPLRPALAAA